LPHPFFQKNSEMTTVLKVNLNDFNLQFVQELKQKFGKTSQIEIRVDDRKAGEGLFSENDFWAIIEKLDWSKKNRDEILQPASLALSKMPMSSLYLFKDLMSEKLFQLDTRAHATAYKAKLNLDYLSNDDFLYARCAVIAEGKTYFESVLQNPFLMPSELDFEHLLTLADYAYLLKTGKQMDYFPTFNYETKSNFDGWK
jgi:Protein of unknown function (DUF4240)